MSLMRGLFLPASGGQADGLGVWWSVSPGKPWLEQVEPCASIRAVLAESPSICFLSNNAWKQTWYRVDSCFPPVQSHFILLHLLKAPGHRMTPTKTVRSAVWARDCSMRSAHYAQNILFFLFFLALCYAKPGWCYV